MSAESKDQDDNTKKSQEDQSPEQVLRGVVKEVKAGGARVELPHGEIGWLPGNEMYADFKPHDDFRERGSGLEGTEIEVIKVASDFDDDQTLVSHIRVENDPWDAVASWQDGEVLVMEVVSLTGVRALGIVEPGVRAEVRLDAMDDLLPASWKGFQKPLPGDEVAGRFEIDEVDHRNRVITLDFAGYVRDDVSLQHVLLPSVAGTRGGDVASRRAESGPPTSEQNFWANAELRSIKEILVVDDNRPFLEPLCGFLISKGCEVVGCVSYDEAEHVVSDPDSEFDLALIDVHLRNTKDYLGIRIASQIHSQLPNCQIILISGEDLDPKHEKVVSASDVEVCAFIDKPFGIQDLYRALTAVQRQRRPMSELFRVDDGRGAMPASRVNERLTAARRLEAVVDALRTEIDAEGVVLFSIHPVTYAVEIVAKSDPKAKYSAAKPNLDRSPVRDVAIDGDEVWVGEVSDSAEMPKHRWLWRAYRYESCIGLPVVMHRGSPVAYALFAFHNDRGHFTEKRSAEVKFAARDIGHILYATALEAELRQMKPFELMGKVYGSMAHDLTSCLSDEFVLDDLEKKLSPGKLGAAADTVRDLRLQSQRARRIVKTFRAMARGQHETIVDFPLDATVADVVGAFKAEARKQGVTLMMVTYEGPALMVHMRKSGLEQIVYNLLLNAAQQMERLRCLRPAGGEIVVEINHQTDEDHAPWALVRAYDTGPGIHKCHFERVFDLHFTTKEEGCGLGLDISRRIAESVELGGRRGSLYVSRSLLLAGTTFELRLPVG